MYINVGVAVNISARVVLEQCPIKQGLFSKLPH